MVDLPLYYERLPEYGEVVEYITNRDFSTPRDPWHLDIFQFWNRQYIEALAREISERIDEMLALEVCAGDGMLAHWLRTRGIDAKATDSGERGVKAQSELEVIDAVSAIRKYRPRMVLASWIEHGSELDCEIIDEKPPFFILIGEEGGCTGSERFWEYYRRLGYRMKQLKKVDRWNLCRTDWDVGSIVDVIAIRRHSETNLFSLP